ncbi:MAG: glycosyltransferase family 39 protein [Betaproteobacteria bacterium]|nr:glycosyltransferase family 39 protein [Betaproteobacteria bacterium]
MNRVADPLVESLRQRISWDGTRTPVKSALFLLVCLAWLLPGLVGHDPWKIDEALALGAVSGMLRTGDWAVPMLAGEPYLDRAPLFFWTAAAFAKVFGGWLALHDAARLASGFFMAITMAGVHGAAVALHGPRAGRIAVLLLIGCLGLLIRAHEMSTDLAGLAGVSLGVAGLSVAARRPWAGGPLLGAGLAIAFLGDGLIPALLVGALALLLPAIGPAWRTRPYGLAVAAGLALAAPLVCAWPVVLAQRDPALSAEWLSVAMATRWAGGATRGAWADLAYFTKILPWYAWPALPLAAWTAWRARRSLAARTDLHLPLAAVLLFFALLSLLAEAREVNAMPILVPLVLLGVAELDSLPRGAASALDWFGVTTFLLMALVLWIGFVAALTGSPEAVAAWLRREVPGFHYPFRFIPFALAALLTCVWVAVVARSLRTTRRAVVNWSAGITMVWMLAMMLGLPLIDQARSYRGVALRLASAIGSSPCTIGAGLGDAQRALLDYFIGLRVVSPGNTDAARCDTLLAQVSRSSSPTVDAARWRETWRGSRPGDRTESFVLYRRAP